MTTSLDHDDFAFLMENARIARALDDASIPIVLLDRTVVPYPRRGHHDLVGIDNRRAGFLITEHLLNLGARRVAFVALPNAVNHVVRRGMRMRNATESSIASSSRNSRMAPDHGSS